mmetsp:Transcript_73671/g.190061  ORF Transcript_73671/g.190061 Transcript_73671/m.190061 type:complete len:920 (+) Transcript_73671:86-2845(+)|eukprot:CAMPEP_0195072976 /NCGR_PEP_ID=MMETSP0448-20130528/16409_1 /TAXON_ID=66468 /ORGANISM="Heterocapsa triquestra, Strain CCMP 448" /LENGTH=919 /DNA_ID=CAMNT_0040105021 /DNA_START=29 /DNA_END=2788 /DNA_ORIENTATION=+
MAAMWRAMGPMECLLLVLGALPVCLGQIIIVDPTTTTTTTRTATVTSSATTYTTVTTTTETTTATTITASTTSSTWTGSSVTTTMTTTTPLCILEEFQRLTFDGATRGKCVDVNQTEVMLVWRGYMEDADCSCQCQSEPMCEAYAYFSLQQACAMYGPIINQGWPAGTRLWRNGADWIEGVLWGSSALAWEVGSATSTNPPVAGMFAFGEYAAEATGDDWFCRIKVNVTEEVLPPDNKRFMCPLGENSSMLACSSQAVLVIFFIFVAPSICCCSFLVVLLQVLKKWDDICTCISSICCGCKRPKRGKERCGEFGRKHGKLGWHIEHVPEDSMLRRGSDVSESDVTEVTEGTEALPEGEASGIISVGSSSKMSLPFKSKPPKRSKKTATKTHVIWDLDTLKVAEAIGAKREKKQKEIQALEDGRPVNSEGDIPEVPNYLEGRSIPATCVDIGGVWGSWMLTATINTSERDGVIIGKVMPKGEEQLGAPKVLLLHEARLRWVVPDPDHEGDLCVLEGQTELADGEDHVVGVAYNRSEEKHTLLVDGRADGCAIGMPLSEDHPDSRLILGSKEWPTHWNFVTPNGRFHFFGEIDNVQYNKGLVRMHVGEDLKMPPTLFVQGEHVEYYSKTHGMWMLGEISIAPPEETEEGHVRETAYTVHMPTSKQKRDMVQLDCMRLPMEKGEACEVFSLSRLGNRWKQGEVVKAKTSRALPSYFVRPTRGAETATTLVTATVTRRRYVQGTRVFVYREPVDGWTGCWTSAQVLAPRVSDVTRRDGWAPGENPDEDGQRMGPRVQGPSSTEQTLLPGLGSSVTGPEISTASSMELGGSPVRGPSLSAVSGFGMPVSGALASNASNASTTSASKLGGRMKAPKEQDGAELGYWTMVPIQEEGSDQAKREMVPSYFIRLPPPRPRDENNPIPV